MTIRFSRSRPTLPYLPTLPWCCFPSSSIIVEAFDSSCPWADFHFSSPKSFKSPPPSALDALCFYIVSRAWCSRAFVYGFNDFPFLFLVFFYFRDQRYFSLDCRHAAMDDMNP